MIGFLVPPSNNNNSNLGKRHDDEDYFSVRRDVPLKNVYTPRCHHVRNDVASVRSFELALLVAVALLSNQVAALALTPPRFTPSAFSRPLQNHRALFSTREAVFTSESLRTFSIESINNNESTMMVQPPPILFYPELQQAKQVKPTATSEESSAFAASWLFAPFVVLLLALPGISSSAATVSSASVVQEAVGNVAFAILPESTSDFISVVFGEGVGYATYFLFTTAAVTSIFSANHYHQNEASMVMERDGDVSLFALVDVDDHHLSFSPVDGGLEGDVLVPCAFNVVEQALPMASERNDSMSQHQSLLHHLDWVEVFFDVTKWLSFFVLQSDLGGSLSYDGGMHPLPHLMESAIFGFLAGFGAKFNADILYRHFGQGPELKRIEMTRGDWPSLCLLEATSAASLFTVYEAVQAPAQEWIRWMTNEVCSTAVASQVILGL